MRRRARYGTLAVVLALVTAVTACAVPTSPAQPVIGLGYHQVEISQFSPVTLYYDGTAGEVLRIVYTTEACGLSGTPCPRLTMKGPDGQPVATGDFINRRTLPSTGRYTLVFDLDGGLWSIFELNLWLVHDVDGGVLTAGTHSYDFSTLTNYQWVSYDYAGEAGQVLQLDSVCDGMYVVVVAPDGTRVTPDGPTPVQVTLPVDGDYELLVDASCPGESTFTLAAA